MTEAPAETTGGFDPSLDGTINGGVPGSPGDEREEYVTVDGGGSGGGGPGDDTAEDNVGDAGAGESGGAGGGGSGVGGGGQGVDEGGPPPGPANALDPGVGFSIIPPGLSESLDPFAGGGPVETPPLGPVYDPPPDNSTATRSTRSRPCNRSRGPRCRCRWRRRRTRAASLREVSRTSYP